MKIIVISTTAFILAIASFGSTAHADVNGFRTKVCQSIPLARPSGGATRERLQAIQRCNKGVRKFNKNSNTKVHQFIPPAEPTGGATRERI